MALKRGMSACGQHHESRGVNCKPKKEKKSQLSPLNSVKAAKCCRLSSTAGERCMRLHACMPTTQTYSPNLVHPPECPIPLQQTAYPLAAYRKQSGGTCLLGSTAAIQASIRHQAACSIYSRHLGQVSGKHSERKPPAGRVVVGNHGNIT